MVLETKAQRALVIRWKPDDGSTPSMASHEVVAPHIDRGAHLLQDIQPTHRRTKHGNVLTNGQCFIGRWDELSSETQHLDGVIHVLERQGSKAVATCPLFNPNGQDVGGVLLAWPALPNHHENQVIKVLSRAAQHIETFLG